MSCLDLPDQRENYDSVSYHAQGVPLDQPLLDVDELTHPSCITDHQGGPVVVTVVCKLITTEPLEPDSPVHGRLVLLIEHVV